MIKLRILKSHIPFFVREIWPVFLAGVYYIAYCEYSCHILYINMLGVNVGTVDTGVCNTQYVCMYACVGSFTCDVRELARLGARG